MSDSTRRGFLGLAGAGAAAVGAAVTPGGLAAAYGSERLGSAGSDSEEPLVAYVENGRLSLMAGEREVVVDDPDLVDRLRRAASGR